MKKKIFGAVVAPISILGLTFALGLGTTAFGAGEEKQLQTGAIISTLNVTSDVPVVPWCGWYVSGVGNDNLVLKPDTGAPAQYTGEQIVLTATAAKNTAYVGPDSRLTEQSGVSACSWFNEAKEKYGARYDIRAAGDMFEAAALTPGTETTGGTKDTGMNFKADDNNPLKITNVGIDTCASQGFTTNVDAVLKNGNLKTTPWTVVTGDVKTNNFCQWTTKYEIKIPASMSPKYGNVTYRWTGPTLTHTLVIPESK
jgi:hypothetical protein